MSMPTVYVIEPEEPRPSLDLATIRIGKSANVLKLLREKKIPLDRLAVADKASGKLYVAEDTSISAVHDPYTGEHITIDAGFQTFIGSIELAQSDLCLHTVFVDNDGSICTEAGTACTLVPCNMVSWTSAMVDLTFGGEK